jgi:hypothetical protein
MKDNTEFQIFIGCQDSGLHGEVVSVDELKEMVEQFFRRKEIGFSMYYAKGGFLHDDGRYVSENSLCINIIGAYDLDIIRLAKSLSMYMNQKCSLVTKSNIKAEYN